MRSRQSVRRGEDLRASAMTFISFSLVGGPKGTLRNIALFPSQKLQFQKLAYDERDSSRAAVAEGRAARVAWSVRFRTGVAGGYRLGLGVRPLIGSTHSYDIAFAQYLVGCCGCSTLGHTRRCNCMDFGKGIASEVISSSAAGGV